MKCEGDERRWDIEVIGRRQRGDIRGLKRKKAQDMKNMVSGRGTSRRNDGIF
ncbi:hypothetical protein E2C01_100075 [Portunus trituberculatus]|uniref:Uncharacterized protein n=1 Tax=Portunus trituberculatus TaxID=210409 RepID=A0A5B7KB37_PORTR|nr:hypothetical protein [Portunus trituberculatus]